MLSKLRISVLIMVAVWAVVGMARATVDAHIKQLGNGGYFKPGCWTPICVSIENFPAAATPADKGEDFKGELVTQLWSNTALPYIFSREVNVPRFSRRNVFLYIKAPSILLSRQTTIAVVNEQGKIIKDLTLTQSNLRVIGKNLSLALIVNMPGQKVRLPQFTDLDVCYKTEVTPEELPDRWYGYQAVDLLIIPKYSANMLSQTQQQALTTWLNLGGRLLIIGGKNFQSYRGSFLEPLLPGKFQGSRDVILPGYGGPDLKVLISYMESKHARLIWQENGIPLVLQKPVGLGELWVANFDLEGSIVDRPEFRRVALDLLAANQVFLGDYVFLNAFADSLDLGLGKAVTLPSIYVIGAILVFYFLALGPINFALLRQKKRVELAWITVPAIVAVFTFSIYLTGLFTKGADIIFREFNITKTRTVSDNGRITTLNYLFSPRNEEYNLVPQERDSAMVSLDDWGAIAGGSGQHMPFKKVLPWQASRWALRAPTKIKLGDQGMTIEEKGLRQWTLFFAESTALANLKGPLKAKVTRASNGEVDYSLTNQTPYQIKDAFLCVADRVAYVGDINPGEAKEHQLLPTVQTGPIDKPLPPQDAGLIPEFGPPLSSVDMAMKPIFDRIEELPERLKDDTYKRYHALRNCLRLAVSEVSPGGFLNVPTRTCLIGLLDTGQRININQAAKTWNCNIIIAELPTIFTDKTSVPSQLIPEEIGSGGYPRAGTLSLNLRPNATVIISSSLPYTVTDYQIDQIELAGKLPNQTNVDFELFIYNINRETWERQEGKEIVINNPHNFASPFRGILFVKLESKAGMSPGYFYRGNNLEITGRYTISSPGPEAEEPTG